ncbi:HNH endonuclease family protein [Arundinibacter roseus]|uniref:TIGR02646 family protein n=1 Tax=Arundinibacter roseus TaxID=2070510 RepID=A0A4R4KJ85_9BACT|nr:hypothetical protein [Arundinibacter roseus]TDB66932.1 hypothetical protein EZE20_07365 [Arundinibacter roseus]
MIRLNNRATLPPPSILSVDGVAAIKKLNSKFENGFVDFKSEDFEKSIYGHPSVKTILIESQAYKCCFCESKIGHIEEGDVEHFRPKSGWVQDEETINKPGYYWLAYSWDNLLLSCSKCNRRHKKNLFPLMPDSIRARSHHEDYTTEEPVFIHPFKENPEQFIEFREEIPVGIDTFGRGNMTIDKLGLDRELLNEQRRDKLRIVRDLYNIARAIPDTTHEIKAEAKRCILKYYNDSLQDSCEYASMLRCFFRKNPIDF